MHYLLRRIPALRQHTKFWNKLILMNWVDRISPLIVSLFLSAAIARAANPNLFVSAENPQFDNHMSGPQVIEVIVIDSAINATDEPVAEPDVTVNGKILRMVQAVDGNWYGYFADRDQARLADETVHAAGVSGEGLDFGAFCSPGTDIGDDFRLDVSDTDGIAVPSASGGSHGTTSLGPIVDDCTGTIEFGFDMNVLRRAKEVNFGNSSFIPKGQIGINPDAWPFIQLFVLPPRGTVIVQYNKAGSLQTVELTFAPMADELANLELDRDRYPRQAQIYATITDFQLNIDPTDEDSWTFATNAANGRFGVYYQVFDSNGFQAADAVDNGTINILSSLDDLMFENNGILSLESDDSNSNGAVVTLQDNNDTDIFASDLENPLAFETFGASTGVEGALGVGTQPITFTETTLNTGIFNAFDESEFSNIRISSFANRGDSATLEYNGKTTTIPVGFSFGSIDLQSAGEEWNSGETAAVTLVDEDANKDSLFAEDLDFFIPDIESIPSVKIGAPFTLSGLQRAVLNDLELNIDLQPFSDRAILTHQGSESIFIADEDRLILSFDEGTTFSDLFSTIHSSTNGFNGFNYINFDLRLIQFFDLGDSFDLIISDGVESLTLITSQFDFQGTVELTNDQIFSFEPSLPVTIEIILHSANGFLFPGDAVPIAIDFFSFGFLGEGIQSSGRINNQIVRFELEETGINTGTFTGGLNYIMLNQLNILDPSTYINQSFIDNEPTIIVHEALTGANAPRIRYLDLGANGVLEEIFDQEATVNNTGVTSFDFETYQPEDTVFISLEDPDLNTNSDSLDIFRVIDPSSGDAAAGTVGEEGLPVFSFGPLGRLLSITFNDHPWISGDECGEGLPGDDGLFATGFTLEEANSDSGVFFGSFQIPTAYCDASTGEIKNTVGTTMKVHYLDFRNDAGEIIEVFDSAEIVGPFTTSNPKIVDMDGNVVEPILVNQEIQITAEVTNRLDREQAFEFLVTVLDTNAQVVFSDSIEATLEANGSANPALPWFPETTGIFTGTVVTQDPSQNPALLLAPSVEFTITVIELSSLGGRIWNDFDNNGIQDDGEPGITDVTLTLRDENDNDVATATADLDGLYNFVDLLPGSYSIRIALPEGFVLSPIDAGVDDTLDSDFDPASRTTSQIILNSGNNNTNLDAGLFASGSLGNLVWNDLNADGIQSTQEPGFEGVAVTLFDESDNLIDTATTDASGFYRFTDLTQGTYRVELEIPDDYQVSPPNQGDDDTLDSDFNGDGIQTETVFLQFGENNPSIDAGLFAFPSIGDLVWNDVNGDGIQDVDEPGVENVNVRLFKSGADIPQGGGDDVLIAETSSTKGGLYFFDALEPGDYFLEFESPVNHEFAPSDVGDDDATDNDVDSSTGRTGVFTLAPNEYLDTIDAGLLAGPGSVLGFKKISDTEGNFLADLSDQDLWGSAVNEIGDLDADGVIDIAVGVRSSTIGFEGRDAIWILFLNADGTVREHQEISSTSGGIPMLGDFAPFGSAISSLGDLDGDGVMDIAVGARETPSVSAGSVWILFLNSNGTVKSAERISSSEPNNGNGLDTTGFFGISMSNLGDVDGDHVNDLAVGAPLERDGGSLTGGAVWILFLKPDGSLKSTQKISASSGDFTGELKFDDEFGRSVSSVGDLDRDGIADLAVSSFNGLWILFLHPEGTVKTHHEISSSSSAPGGELTDFSGSLSTVGDIDGDGISDLMIGASGDDDGGASTGAIWTLFLNQDGTVKFQQKISDLRGNFNGNLEEGDLFGASVSSLGDIDGDQVVDIIAGAPGDDDADEGVGTDRGAVWILNLKGVPLASISGLVFNDIDQDGIRDNSEPGQDGVSVNVYTPGLDGQPGGGDDFFLASVTTSHGGNYEFRNLNTGDYFVEFQLPRNQDFTLNDVGTDDGVDSDADTDSGRTVVISLESGEEMDTIDAGLLLRRGSVQSALKISDSAGNFEGKLQNFDFFGAAVSSLGDLDGDDIADLIVGASGDDQGGANTGALWIINLHADGSVKTFSKIDNSTEQLSGKLTGDGAFGSAVSPIGDLNRDENLDLAVGAPGDDDGGGESGALWILLLDGAGEVLEGQKITTGSRDFEGILDVNDDFGHSVTRLGDFDQDGVLDLAVGAPGDDDGSDDGNRGAIWLLFLTVDARVKDFQKISATEGSFVDALEVNDSFFGTSVTSLDDLDGDGVLDLAVGGNSAVWILFLNSTTGTVKSFTKINSTDPVFNGELKNSFGFGNSVTNLGDLDGDDVTDIAVGASFDADGGEGRGAVWIMFLNTDGTVKNYQKISSTFGNFSGVLNNNDRFGTSLSSFGDFDGNGVVDLLVGADGDDDARSGTGTQRGAIWLLPLNNGGPPTISVGDRVWIDSNGNGLQNEGEQGQGGVEVSLWDAGLDQLQDTDDDLLLGSTTTDANGHYSFHVQSASTYFLEFALPDGFQFSPQDQGDDDTIDSDVGSTEFSTPFNLNSGEIDLSRDAGLTPPPIEIDTDDVTQINIGEGGSFSLQIALKSPPLTEVELEIVPISEETDIEISSGLPLVFNENDWNEFKNVTLIAKEDDDLGNDMEIIRIQKTSDSNAIIASVEIPVQIIDDELTLTISINGNGKVIIGEDTPMEITSNFNALIDRNEQGAALVALSAVAEEGHNFSGWTGDIDKLDPTDLPNTQLSTMENVTLTANFLISTPPRVRITSPTELSEFTAPASIPIVIEAEDDDGSIVDVVLAREPCEEENPDGACGCTEIGNASQDGNNPAQWVFAWQIADVGDYKLKARAEDDSGRITCSEFHRVSVVPFSFTFTRPVPNEAPVKQGDSYQFTWDISPEAGLFEFRLYLFESPTLTLTQIENGEPILLNNSLSSNFDRSGFNHNLQNAVRNDENETTWYPHVLITSGPFINQIHSGENTLTVKRESIVVQEEVTITVTTPSSGLEILYGQGVELVAGISGQSPVVGTNTVTVIFESPNQDINEILELAINGSIQLTNPFVPADTGPWQLRIDWPGNAEFKPKVSENINFTVKKSKARLELFNLGAPHFKGRPLRIVGQLSLLNGNPGQVNLGGIPIALSVLDENGVSLDTSDLAEFDGFPDDTSVLTDEDGFFEFTFDITMHPEFFSREGNWSIQAHSIGNDNLSEVLSSEGHPIPVRSKRGYAILCQGSIPPDNDGIVEGLEQHRETLKFVKRVLETDGSFINDDTSPNEGQDDIFEIDETTTNPKKELERAITEWATSRMLGNPAPLYLVLVNHGEEDEFHINSGSSNEDDNIFTPDELAQWVDTLQAGLKDHPIAKDEKIIIVLGMCFSGSFMDELRVDDEENNDRIVISASAAKERSIRGPGEENSDIRQGEYFVYLLFRELSTGANLLTSFERSRDAILRTSEQFQLVTNTADLFNGEFGQHAWLDDNGDGRGTHTIVPAQEGQTMSVDGEKAKTVVLKVLTNDPLGILEIDRVNPSRFLSSDETEPPDLWAEVNEDPSDQIVEKIFLDVKRPDDLKPDETKGDNVIESMQADLELKRQPMEERNREDRVRFEWPMQVDPSLSDRGLFDSPPGAYQVFFYVKSAIDRSISKPVTSTVYRASGNQTPTEPTLTSPEQSADPTNPTPLVYGTSPDSGIFRWTTSTSTLFSLTSSVETIVDLLDNRLMPDQIATELANRNKTVTDNVKVEIVSVGNEWTIRDRPNVFVVKKDGDTLNIFLQVRYIFRLWLDPNEEDLAFESVPLIPSFFLLTPNLVIDGFEYWWDVVAVDEEGNATMSSERRNFLVVKPDGIPGFVFGKIQNRETGDLLVNAQVFINNNPVVNTDQGFYVAVVTSGTHTISVQAPGFEDSDDTLVTLTPALAVEQNFRLQSGIERPRTLTIISEADGVVDALGSPVGAGDYEFGTIASWSVTTPWSIGEKTNTVRYVADNDSGSRLMDDDQEVTIIWTKQIYLNIQQIGGGIVEPASGWFSSNDTEITLTASNTDLFHFNRWEGDVEPNADATSNTLLIGTDQSKRITAIFDLIGEPNATSDVVKLSPGWNLFSLPIYPEDPDPQKILENMFIGRVWYWDRSSYVLATELSTKTGYWAYCPVGDEIEINLKGVEDNNDTKVLGENWQLVGPLDARSLPDSENVVSMAWEWDGEKFIKATFFEEGKGYWIYLHKSDSVQLGSD